MENIFTGFSQNLHTYIGFIWLPITLLVVHKQHRPVALAFVFTCLMTFFVQVELIASTGYRTGFLPLLQSDIFARGLIFYSAAIFVYLGLAHFSPKTEKMIFFAASLSIYILSFCLSMALMAL